MEMNNAIPEYIPNVGYYCFVDKETKSVQPNIEPVRVIRKTKPKKKPKTYIMSNDGKVTEVTERKYDHSFKPIAIEKEQFLDNNTLVIEENKVVQKEDTPTIRLGITNDETGKTFYVHLSNKQLWRIRKKIVDYYISDKDIVDDIQPEFCNEVKAVIILLNNPEYAISTNELVEIGVKYPTAVSLLQSMVSRKILMESKDNKVGKVKYYIPTIPRNELNDIFGGMFKSPYNEDDEQSEMFVGKED